jgi:glycosyltransferase involved in cell wall biosynthesis
MQQIEQSPIGRSIDLVGFVPAEQLDSVFDDADIFVLPYSSVSGFSSSGVEFRAAAAGLPIVASDLGTVREHVVHRKTGLIFPAGDADAFAEAIRVLARDSSLRLRLGATAQAHIGRRHSAEAVAAQVVPVYEQLARKSVRRAAG